MVQTPELTTTTISDEILSAASSVHRNLTEPVLYEHAVKRDEGKLLVGGSFAVRTGKRTGRSALYFGL
jgi:phosphoenolpyruvate carboxykinase (ATP)